MKVVTLIFISILCLQIDGYLIKIPSSITNDNTRIVTGGWLHIQNLLLPLYENVCEESTDAFVVTLNQEFELDPSNGIYVKPEVVDNFRNLKTMKGLLSKGEIFTETNSDHLNELRIIYELLYYAGDFDTFYKAACWARQNVNCGLFVDAIYLAVLKRPDTEKILMPAPYEILPNYFIRKDFIIKASSLIRGETVSQTDNIRNEGNAYILDVNYTSSIYDGGEDKLAYFREDIGLNSYYFFMKLMNWPWLYESRRNNFGQDFYHTIKESAARYDLERYSNGLPELEGIDWSYINESSYDPMLIYSNGNEFSQRTAVNIGDNEILTALKDMERSLPAVVLDLSEEGCNKTDILNHLMELLVTSERSYMNLALKFVSEDRLLRRTPSVLEHYMTSVRDPIFWKINKKIVNLVDNVLNVLPSYSINQLYFPGVEIQNIEVKKMMTLSDYFEFDVTNALKSKGDDSKFQVKIGQSRLNHKSFSFKISVSSLVEQKALVKLYMGPKVMPGELVEKKNLFMLLDCFEINLKFGNNLIKRASHEMTSFSEDLLSVETIRKIILDAEFGVNNLNLKSVRSQIKFPSRLILPKGTSEGLPLSIFVFIAPYVKATVGGSRTNIDLNVDAINTPRFPLDLNIEIQQLFNLPNAIMKDITIVHKTESAFYNRPFNSYSSVLNDKIWQTGDLETDISSDPLSLNGRPEFTKKSFDYESKKNQYGQNNVYTAKRDGYKYHSKSVEETIIDADEDKINANLDSANMEIINNIYINPDLLHNAMRDVDNEKSFHSDVTSDADYERDRDLEKNIDTQNQETNKSESKTVNIINNVFTGHGLEHDKIPVVNSDETVHSVFTLDRNDVNDFSLNMKPDEIESEKGMEPINLDYIAHSMLTTPRKKYSNIFNIIFKPLNKESGEKVYE